MAAIGCRPFRQSLSVGRRDFLRAGLLGAGGAWGLSLPQLLRAEASGAAARRETSVIILWMRGGPSHIDMWDMKPDAPSEYRGEFHPVPTSVPGIDICEHLPQTAACMDKWSIVRSLHHRQEDGNASHTTGDLICFTGYPAVGQAAPEGPGNVYPSCGSIAKKQLQQLDASLPAYVMVPRMVPGTGAGYLGPAFRPFETLADPADLADAGRPFSVPNLQPPEGLSVSRLGDRQTLLREMDGIRRDMDGSGMMDAMDDFNRQAWEMVTGEAAREAFNLDAEPPSVRRRYGFFPRYRSTRVVAGGDAPCWNQRILLARRLVEAGVRLVTVDCRWWDTHEDNFWSLKNEFLPRWDQAYSALIHDLDKRGLLEKTLVVAWGEIGRTPRINTRQGSDKAGRDHWPNAMAAAITGGGVRGGRLVGSTDSKASEPKDNPKIPQDVLATVYHHLGVDAAASYVDHAGRPHPVIPAGRPIDELF